jgi:Domain of unknown function (DUF4157)
MLDVLRDSGWPLAAPLRPEMEARLGASLSDVRLHVGEAARASAAELGARAYTSGSHIVIGDGGADSHTLAHELAHVLQQREGAVSGTDRAAAARSVPFAPARQVVQRTITISERKMDWTKAKPILLKLGENDDSDDPSLASLFSGREQDLDIVLQYLDERNYIARTPEMTFGAIRNLSAQLNQFMATSVNPATWAVLHRLRAVESNFNAFLRERRKAISPLPSKDEKEEREHFEELKAKYNPSSYGDDNRHTWEGSGPESTR